MAGNKYANPQNDSPSLNKRAVIKLQWVHRKENEVNLMQQFS